MIALVDTLRKFGMVIAYMVAKNSIAATIYPAFVIM